MVRLLFIRHAESQGNVAHELTSVRVRRGDIKPSQQMDERLKLLEAEDGDHALTELGQKQAQQLGQFYAPLLLEKAKQGKVHLWVSPQLRTMQTASPLFTELHSKTGVTANLRTTLHEHEPPYHKSSWPVLKRANQMRLELAQKTQDRKQISSQVDKFLSANKEAFIPTGMTPEELRHAFPWCVPPADLPEGCRPFDKGPETLQTSLDRARSNAAWFAGLQATLGNDEVVVCVCHGYMMGITMKYMLNIPTTPDRCVCTTLFITFCG
jgi:broad specificity phosphatase PhoE